MKCRRDGITNSCCAAHKPKLKNDSEGDPVKASENAPTGVP